MRDLRETLTFQRASESESKDELTDVSRRAEEKVIVPVLSGILGYNRHWKHGVSSKRKTPIPTVPFVSALAGKY